MCPWKHPHGLRHYQGASCMILGLPKFWGRSAKIASARICQFWRDFLHSETGNWKACMCRSLQITTVAHHILIVEKEAVFRTLCEARLWDLMPVVLVTGQGMPDIATRAMVSQITHASAPSSKLSFRGEVPKASEKCVMGLVDWNPSGCYILCNYKFGNKKATKQSTAYATAQFIVLSFISNTPALCRKDVAMTIGLGRWGMEGSLTDVELGISIYSGYEHSWRVWNVL